MEFGLENAPREGMEREQEQKALLVRVSQAGDILGVGRSTVYELIASGELETVHIGRCCRIPVAALEDYVARLRGPAAASPAS